MPYTYEVQKTDGYIFLTSSGEIRSEEDLVSLGRSMKDLAARLDCRRFLIDERSVDMKIDPLTLTEFAEGRIDEPRSNMRVAVIYTPENLSRLHWIETFLQNRCIPYRQFSSFEQATQWLMS
ncbi:hypothetical protein DND132_1013 [Pseudodesulfovibrio mercurii]|uniref:STAS/SEC14 domain-containing protein n=1 Tax=Pseudodesulfovibrio mercurii TaxID=641491 RepID=F0JIH4_9BACT|nr:hypothetical protein [Pseudodesulfovibrio mercurii]EGB14226.1 hypothetical protein DND132_1013 [Pseudodesulfovibrio mercurii]